MYVGRSGAIDPRFANLDADGTVDLCNSLADYAEAGGLSLELMLRVGRFAEIKYTGNADVLMAVARMYFHGGELTRARSTLLKAGRMGPEDARLRLLLGEVLMALADPRTVTEALSEARARSDSTFPPDESPSS